MYSNFDDFIDNAKIKIIDRLTDAGFTKDFSVNEYCYSKSLQHIKVIFTESQSDRLTSMFESLFAGDPLFSGITCTNDFKEFSVIFSIKNAAKEYYISVINREGKDGYLMWETDAMYIGDTLDKAYHYDSVSAAVSAGQTVARQYNIVKPNIKVLQVTEVYNN